MGSGVIHYEITLSWDVKEHLILNTGDEILYFSGAVIQYFQGKVDQCSWARAMFKKPSEYSVPEIIAILEKARKETT